MNNMNICHICTSLDKSKPLHSIRSDSTEMSSCVDELMKKSEQTSKNLMLYEISTISLNFFLL